MPGRQSLVETASVGHKGSTATVPPRTASLPCGAVAEPPTTTSRVPNAPTRFQVVPSGVAVTEPLIAVRESEKKFMLTVAAAALAVSVHCRLLE